MTQIAARLADMDEFVSAAPAVLMPRIVNAQLARLLADWQAHQPPDGRLPSRADFPPERLRYILGNLILWDVAGDPPQATCRLFGANLVFQRGFDLTGKTPDQHPDPVVAALTRFGLVRVLASRAPLLTRGRHPHADGSTMLIETVSLPLASDGRTIDRIMHGQINRTLVYEEVVRKSDVRMACAAVPDLLPQVGDPRLQRLLRDWEDWRGRDALPDRSKVTPENLRSLLGSLFLFDIEPGDDGPRFRYRLFGSAVAAHRGFDLTGRCIDEHPDVAFAARAQLAYRQAVAAKLPLWARVDGISPGGLVSRFEALILPLARDRATPDQVLSAQVMIEPDTLLSDPPDSAI